MTDYETITRMGDIADAALTKYHHVGYAERLNTLLDALHLVSQERIEWANMQDHKEVVNG